MKNIRWLLELANKKPLIFSLALLMIAVSTLSVVVANRDKKIDECNNEKKQLQQYYDKKFDSLYTYYRIREKILNERLQGTLNSIIESYKLQLEEQKELNQRISTTIRRNRSIIKRNNSKILNLQQ